MKAFYRGEELFVYDYIYKKNGTVDVLIISSVDGKRWVNIPRGFLSEEDIKPDNKNNHYE